MKKGARLPTKTRHEKTPVVRPTALGGAAACDFQAFYATYYTFSSAMGFAVATLFGARIVITEGTCCLFKLPIVAAAGVAVHGGALLTGLNFAPTHFLWCAFGVPPEHADARGAWRHTRGAYLNSTAIRCEVPPGFVGDFPVAASAS